MELLIVFSWFLFGGFWTLFGLILGICIAEWKYDIPKDKRFTTIMNEI